MRSDMVPGATFPDYELSGHTAKRRKLCELQRQHPMGGCEMPARQCAVPDKNRGTDGTWMWSSAADHFGTAQPDVALGVSR